MPAISSGTTVTALRQVALTVSDVARSTAFYRDQVGLPFLFAAGPSLAFLAIGSVRLMLSAPEGDLRPGLSSVLYLKVDDIIGAQEEMSARGVTFLTPPHRIAEMPDHDLWLSDFKDPDGNIMALMSERPKGSA